jgi:CHAT domain-containing protein
MAARFSAGSDALAAVVREQQDTVQRWQRLDHAIVQAASKPPSQRNPEAEAVLRQQFTETGAQLDALGARIAREFPAYAELSNPKPLEMAQAQVLLAPDEAMLVYLVGADETWLWALRRDRAALYPIKTGAKALTAEVAALRNRLDPDLNPDLAPFDTKRAFALYQDILVPAASLLDGARQVFIVPDGGLESLPLGVLVTQASETDPRNLSDYRDIAWFARDHALTVLPSVGALRALRKFASGTSAIAPFVGIGNPMLEGTPSVGRGIKLAGLFRGAIADVAAVRQLPPLPETADELRMVAKAMGAGEEDLYLAERASEPLLRQAGLDRYRVVEFATHGLMSGDLAGLAEPALVLTPPPEASPDNDGLLTASKVATLKLNASWVVLSACNTAAGDGTADAGGLSGLAKAFFYAGARSLLVSHWSVPSQATVKLVTRAFDELETDPSIGRAEALRRAEMAMLDPANPPEFAHPMMWAPFVLVGEGGAGL